MKIRLKLIVYSFSIVILTGLSTTGGAIYHKVVETNRDKQERLSGASINFQRRLNGFIHNSIQHFTYFSQKTDYPLMVLTEGNLGKNGLYITDSGLIDALYSLSKSIQAHSFGFYFPYGKDNPDELRYVYCTCSGGLIKIRPEAAAGFSD